MTLRHVGDVVRARADLERRPGANLRYVLRKRIAWMQRYLGSQTYAVELGCGAGFSELFLQAGPLELTDTEPRPWVRRVVDALAMPYADASIDVLIANNVIHHLAYPTTFFREAARVLRPGGHLLVQECDCSLTTRLAIRITGHEAYDLRADPFDASRPCNDPRDPWSANCAIPNLLFDDLDRFRVRCPDFEVLETGRSEFFLHFNSGGITSRGPYLPLPELALRVLDCKNPACQSVLDQAPSIHDSLCFECAQHFLDVRQYLEAMGIASEVNPRLVRGLDYYVRTTFELTTTELGAQNAVAGGGRYDGLIERLGGPPDPGIGFAIGVERVALLLADMREDDWEHRRPVAFLIPIGDEALKRLLAVARAVRTTLPIELGYGNRKLRSELERAHKMRIPWAVIVGETELAAGSAVLRDMEAGQQQQVPFPELARRLMELGGRS